jgi:hypothetical protein
MSHFRSMNLPAVLKYAAILLIAKVVASVVWGYREYFPPNFRADFLQGREPYFFGLYQWAFYPHIVSGPLSLILGLVLLSESFRIHFPKWHRTLGKIQISLIVLVLAPSGLWMARYAESGAIAASGFSALAIATAYSALIGWQTAVQRRFAAHRRWMLRCFLLLSSAVVLRLIGGASAVTNVGVAWGYPLAAWASWLVPLAAFELRGPCQRQLERLESVKVSHFLSSTAAPSGSDIEISLRRSSAGKSLKRKCTLPSEQTALTPYE